MLDPRLFPLLETLARANLDWLAQEVMEGAAVGSLPGESAAVLEAARKSVFRDRQELGDHRIEVIALQPSKPLSANEQILWAMSHVSERLEEVLTMIGHSIARLDDIAISRAPSQGAAVDILGGSVGLMDGEAVQTVNTLQIIAATAAVTDLRTALQTWAATALESRAPQ